MTIIQQRNAEAEMLTQVDQSHAERNHLFKALGSTVIGLSTSVVQATYATTTYNTATDLFSFDGTALTITEAGFYLLTLRIILLAGASGPQEATVFWEEDPNTGVWTTVPGSSMYVNMSANLRATAFSRIVHQVGTDYRYRVSMQRTSGVDTINTNGNRSFDCIRLFGTE